MGFPTGKHRGDLKWRKVQSKLAVKMQIHVKQPMIADYRILEISISNGNKYRTSPSFEQSKPQLRPMMKNISEASASVMVS